MVREDNRYIEVCASVRSGSMQTSAVVSVASTDGTARGKFVFHKSLITRNSFNKFFQFLVTIPG